MKYFKQISETKRNNINQYALYQTDLNIFKGKQQCVCGCVYMSVCLCGCVHACMHVGVDPQIHIHICIHIVKIHTQYS